MQLCKQGHELTLAPPCLNEGSQADTWHGSRAEAAAAAGLDLHALPPRPPPSLPHAALGQPLAQKPEGQAQAPPAQAAGRLPPA